MCNVHVYVLLVFEVKGSLRIPLPFWSALLDDFLYNSTHELANENPLVVTIIEFNYSVKKDSSIVVVSACS